MCDKAHESSLNKGQNASCGFGQLAEKYTRHADILSGFVWKLAHESNDSRAFLFAVDACCGAWQDSRMAENVNETKNPAAVALGRLGGLKGGKARAQKLSASARKRIATKAAATRWTKKSQKPSGNT